MRKAWILLAPGHVLITAALACIAFALGALPRAGWASGTAASSGPVLRHHEVKPTDLGAPTPDEANVSRLIPRPAAAKLAMPPGFEIATFAEGGFGRPRWLAQSPNGDVLVSDSDSGTVILLRDADADGVPEQRHTFARGLNQPFGMAFWGDHFYVANTDAVLRYRYRAGETRVEGSPDTLIRLPGRGYRQHWTRNICFSPDGSKLYVTVGSRSNVSEEQDPMRAAIWEFNPDGSEGRPVATGTRNPIGLAFRPGTRELWAAVQERDNLGDELVPDYVTRVVDGGFYGWPYFYIGSHQDPRWSKSPAQLREKVVVPDVLLRAHSAVLGLAFYDAKMFPAEYRGDAFAALHGSWNRAKLTGYKIIRIRFRDGRPVGGYDDFIAGWMLGEDSPEVWGRPVGLLVLRDGSLLITDDGADKLWRVTYRAPEAGGR